MITSSAIARVCGATANARSVGQLRRFGLGHSGDELPVAAHPLPVEGRQHHLALVQVLATVEQEQGAWAERRAQ
jgi:hypothetical protein